MNTMEQDWAKKKKKLPIPVDRAEATSIHPHPPTHIYPVSTLSMGRREYSLNCVTVYALIIGVLYLGII